MKREGEKDLERDKKFFIFDFYFAFTTTRRLHELPVVYTERLRNNVFIIEIDGFNISYNMLRLLHSFRT